MKNIKKIFSMILSLIMLFTLAIPVEASDNLDIKEIRNDNDVVVIQETKEDEIIIATNDKRTNILTVEKYQKNSNTLISRNITDLNVLREKSEKKVILNERMARASGHTYQHTFSNREYDRWSGNPNKWKCRIPSGIKNVNENSSNRSDLRTFADHVEEVNEAEFVIIGAVGGTAAATAIAAFLTGGTAAGVAAAGGGSAIVAAFANLNSACNKADLAYSYI